SEILSKSGEVPARGRVPEPDRGFAAGRCQSFAIRVKRNAEHNSDVSLQNRSVLPTGDVPQLDDLVFARGRQSLAVRTEPHRPGMSIKNAGLPAGRHIPELDRFIPASGDERLPIGTEHHARDTTRVPAPGRDVLAGRYFPQLDRLVFRSG